MMGVSTPARQGTQWSVHFSTSHMYVCVCGSIILPTNIAIQPKEITTLIFFTSRAEELGDANHQLSGRAISRHHLSYNQEADFEWDSWGNLKRK